MDNELKEAKPLRVFQCPKCNGSKSVPCNIPGRYGPVDCGMCNGIGVIFLLESELTDKNLAGLGLKITREFKEVLC